MTDPQPPLSKPKGQKLPPQKPGVLGASPGGLLPPSTTSSRTSKKWTVTNQPTKRGKKCVLYGTGGIGKTSLLALAPNLCMIDLEDRSADVQRVAEEAAKAAGTQWKLNRITGLGVDQNGQFDAANGWFDLLDIVRPANWEDLWPPGSTCGIDSLTIAEDWSYAGLIKERPNSEGGALIRDVEDYGFGKGFSHAYKMMVSLLRDLDNLAQRGVNIILVCHECQCEVADPQIGTFTRYEPRLYKARNGNSDTRAKVKEWADHVLFMDYDKDKVDDKRARGQGTRTIYCHERPSFIAKSSIPFATLPMDGPFDGQVWSHIFNT